MTTAANLAEFRARFPGCELVLIADIAAETVLAWDSALKVPQEDLDAFARRAGKLLAPPQDDGERGFRSATVLRPTGSEMMLALPEDAEIVICASFSVHASMEGAMDAAQTVLSEAGTGGAA